MSSASHTFTAEMAVLEILGLTVLKEFGRRKEDLGLPTTDLIRIVGNWRGSEVESREPLWSQLIWLKEGCSEDSHKTNQVAIYLRLPTD